jgi:hypothetical protein
MNNATYVSETNPSHLDQVLDAAAPYWNYIVRLEIAGEPPWDHATTQSRIQQVQNALMAHCLSDRPMGVLLHPNSSHYNDVVDVTGLERQVEPAMLKKSAKSSDCQYESTLD